MASKEQFIKLWEQCFEAADTSNDGIVTFDEMMALQGKVKGESKKLAKEIFEREISNPTKRLTLTRFKALGEEAWGERGPFPQIVLDMMTEISSIGAAARALKEGKNKAVQELKAMFDKFDTDSNGTLDLKELQYFSARMGAPLDQKELEVAIKEMDTTKDGVVSFEELYAWWTHAKRTKKDNSKLAMLYAKASNDYLSESVISLFNKLSVEDAKNAKNMLESECAIQIGECDQKACKSHIKLDIVNYSGEGLPSGMAGSIVLTAKCGAEESKDLLKNFNATLEGVFPGMEKERVPPPIQAALRNTKLEYKDGILTFKTFVPDMPGTGPPFDKLPFKLDDVLKEASIFIGLPFDLKEVTDKDGGNTKSIGDLLEAFFHMKYKVNKKFIWASMEKFQTNRYMPKEVRLGIAMLAAFKSSEGVMKFNSVKEIITTLQQFEYFKRLFPPPMTMALALQPSAAFEMAHQMCGALIQPLPDRNAPPFAKDMVNALISSRNVEEITGLKFGWKSAGKAIDVGVKGLLYPGLAPPLDNLMPKKLRG